eukprot:Gregarina_sp_Poly_1__4184@NODE_228_length_11160_cov_127_571532_g202_i0_p8_GENE_NODE_228_length_11160_cov_127_571532_g202_i0NODE_228_length_11160_cov_127_571532_g202_i0_p8_ORF_typecomplete_len111_score8_88_NODE_228_length_11160_cov_127_571532_g202_i07041036
MTNPPCRHEPKSYKRRRIGSSQAGPSSYVLPSRVLAHKERPNALSDDNKLTTESLRLLLENVPDDCLLYMVKFDPSRLLRLCPRAKSLWDRYLSFIKPLNIRHLQNLLYA